MTYSKTLLFCYIYNNGKFNLDFTGASSGGGKALALKFAKNNWKVAISARREELLKDIEKSNQKYKIFQTRYKKC